MLFGCASPNDDSPTYNKTKTEKEVTEKDHWCKKGDVFYMKPDSTKLLAYKINSDGTFNGLYYTENGLKSNYNCKKWEIFGKMKYVEYE